MPFVIHGKISFSPFVAPPLKGKNPIPIPPNYGIKPFPGSELKLISKITLGEIPDILSKNVKIRNILTNTQENSFPGSCQDLGKKFPWVLARPRKRISLGLAKTKHFSCLILLLLVKFSLTTRKCNSLGVEK